MRMIVLSIRDVALGVFSRPMFVPTVAAGVRGFRDEVMRKDSEMGQHPGDYSLWQVSVFDDDSGGFDQMQPIKIAEASHVSE